jgi:hypothetical protein
MSPFQLPVRNQRGIATTEFIVVSFVFVVIFAGFVLIGETIMSKMKSLIMARNLAFDQIDRSEFGNFSHRLEVVMAAKTPEVMLDKCLWPYFAVKPSRKQAQVNLDVATFFDAWVPGFRISDQYLIAQNSWQGISPAAMAALVTGCGS